MKSSTCPQQQSGNTVITELRFCVAAKALHSRRISFDNPLHI